MGPASAVEASANARGQSGGAFISFILNATPWDPISSPDSATPTGQNYAAARWRTFQVMIMSVYEKVDHCLHVPVPIDLDRRSYVLSYGARNAYELPHCVTIKVEILFFVRDVDVFESEPVDLLLNLGR